NTNQTKIYLNPPLDPKIVNIKIVTDMTIKIDNENLKIDGKNRFSDGQNIFSDGQNLKNLNRKFENILCC
ncbi:MAG: hypothetical protein Q4F97_10895, partial [Bacteroidales bacterium]|nr:hypothetical protein [Bacteroidales bacterium]